MLSAIAPRKDSAQSSKDALKKRTPDYFPHSTPPLANCPTPDIVTNDERAKSPDLMRVLSPMRPRRTPKLVNAPEIRWRLPPSLQCMPSLDSLFSSNTSASEMSTVRHVPTGPHNIALPVSSTSSVITTLPDALPQDPPLPPPPPPPSSSPSQNQTQYNTMFRPSERQLRLDTRFNEAHVTERPRIVPQLCAHQPHPLSPVTEVSSAPSIRSSITDVRVQEIGTAERRLLSDVRRQNVHVVGASEEKFGAPRVESLGHRGKRHSQSIRDTERGGSDEEQRVGSRKMLGRLSESVKDAARKVVESVARQYVTVLLARVL
ncbi:hypothetical protein E8E12_004773 [Didymella heteroderae]|uniref:Uncharacterized protein n=1 Tax=Didymella heteroderae TaxID=1769908 RepID=A0A9P5BX20_9PLEO|nr:hypothetical protein E8E12_004773 [Didymella heteroderae]